MRLSASPCLPSRLSACYNSKIAERIFIKFDIWEVSLKFVAKFQFWPKINNNHTLHEDLITCISGVNRVYLAKYLSERNMYRTKVVEKIDIYICFKSSTIFPLTLRFLR
jgi:hypothetical protein